MENKGAPPIPKRLAKAVGPDAVDVPDVDAVYHAVKHVDQLRQGHGNGQTQDRRGYTSHAKILSFCFFNRRLAHRSSPLCYKILIRSIDLSGNIFNHKGSSGFIS